MRHRHASESPDVQSRATGEIATLRTLLPYLWPSDQPSLRLRVVAAIAFLIAAKAANVVVPVFYKHAVDALTATGSGALIVVPVAMLIAYGVARVLSQAFGEAARRRVRQGGAAGDAHRRPSDLPPSAAPEPALSPRPPHRRGQPRHRARHEGHRVPALASCCSTSCRRWSRSLLVCGILWWLFGIALRRA